MKKYSLNGTWELRGGSGDRGGVGRFPHFEAPERFMKAEVPGSVHETLIKLGLIKEPTLGKNVLEARWVEEWVWGYRRTFILSAEDLKSKVRIVFACLDLTAAVYINGREAGRHNNYYYPCRLDITGLVREGENTIFVRVESGLIAAADKPAIPYYGASNDSGKLTKRMWMRKPQCSFEWDWSPRLVNVGIPGDVTIECGEVFVNDVSILSEVNEDYSDANVEVRVFLNNLSGGVRDVKMKVTVLDTGEEYTAPADMQIKHGTAAVKNAFTVKNPKLWNPIHFGEQYRYSFKVEVVDGNDKIYENVIRTGFRKVEIDQSIHPERGTYFILKVNGRKIFAKGGNFVPADIVYSRITREDYGILIERALESNCNALRVWGGGMYESDDFYDLCDEAGIVVWQDCINACSTYPSNDMTFFENYRAEITYQIRRLAKYPSLVILSGNNEIEWQVWEQWGGERYPDANLYHWLLPRTLAQENPYIYYQPSSPFSPDFQYPNDDYTGDQHPWNIGFSDFDFYKYRTYECRFPNEGGLRGPNSLPAMMACLDKGEEYMHSLSWQVHENSIDDWGSHNSADFMVREWLNIEPLGKSIEEYVYLGGFIQGEGLTEYILNFRRRKYNSASAIFWMYNDCWPTTRSWTTVDYYRNRTPSFYPVKRAFNPVAVDIVKENGKLSVYGISDLPEDGLYFLEYGIFATDGQYLEKKTIKAALTGNESNVIAEIDYALWNEAGNKKAVPYAVLYKDGKIISSRRYIEVKHFELELSAPDIKIMNEDGRIYIESNVFAVGVAVDLNGEECGDNFFDLFPGIKKEITSDKQKIYCLNEFLMENQCMLY